MVQNEAVIIDAIRTPIGRASKGSLVSVRPDDLAGLAIAALLDRVDGLAGSEVDDVILGCGMTHHEAGYNIARSAAVLSGLPSTVPGTTVNRLCASSLQAIRMAFHAVRAGEGSAYVAAGTESLSRCLGKGLSTSDFNPRFVDRTRDDYVNDMYIAMGLTAENVANEFGVSRQDMDDFAALSQQRATRAQESGFFDDEIVPVELEDGTVVVRDDGPRPGTTSERLAELRPSFVEGGRVTAGNSCPLNDGAAAVLVMSEAAAERRQITPRARIVASAVAGVEPERMGIGPVPAVQAVLDAAGMAIGDVDVVELNEAFAAQVLPVCDQLHIDVDRQLNPNGGAIALGHPFGMTGARMMTTLLHELEASDREIGLETMCVGGGQGMAMIVQRLS